MAVRRKNKQHGTNMQHGMRQRKLRLEHLETRALLAGNISVDVAGGNLLIRGDNGANQVAVLQLDDGAYAVVGFNGTEVEGEAEPFIVEGITGNIDIDLKKGNDLLGVGNEVSGLIALAQDLGFGGALGDAVALEADLLALLEDAEAPARLEVPRHLLVRAGDGRDGVGVSADIGRGVNVNLGSGNNTFALVGSTVEDNVIVRAGSGADHLLVLGSQIDGVLDANLGNGQNLVEIFGSSIGKTAVLITGKHRDIIAIVDSSIDDHLIVRTGSGRDDVLGLAGQGSGLAVDGNVDIDTGAHDDVVVLTGGIDGNVNIRTLGGNDVVELEELNIRKNLYVNLGTGHDGMFAGFTSIGGNATLDAGSGDDVITLLACDVAKVFVALMGSGKDVLNVFDSSAQRAILRGGSSSDTLNYDNKNFADNVDVREFEKKNLIVLEEEEEEEEEEVEATATTPGGSVIIWTAVMSLEAPTIEVGVN